MDIEKAQTWHYDRHAEQYVGVDQGLNRILSRVVLPRAASVLDVGCGIGNLTLRLREKGSPQRVVGIDVSGGVLSIARRHARELGLSNFEFVRASAMDLPFADGGFDVVVSNMVFHLIPDQGRALCEIVRVLRPLGSTVLHFLGGGDFAPEITQIFNRAWNEVLPQTQAPRLTHDLTVKQAAEILAAAGMTEFGIAWHRSSHCITEADVPEFLRFWHLVSGYWRHGLSEGVADRIQDIFDGQVRARAKSSGQFEYALDLLLLRFTRPETL